MKENKKVLDDVKEYVRKALYNLYRFMSISTKGKAIAMVSDGKEILSRVRSECVGCGVVKSFVLKR